MDGKTQVIQSSAPRRGNLLLVDDDDLLVEMIESGLHLLRPKWSVIATRHPSKALGVLAEYSEFDAIITEVMFAQSSGLGTAFIHEVGARWPDIPIFAMTSLAPEEVRGLDTAEHIAKPPDMDFLVCRVDRAIRRQRESLVRGISLMAFLQILEIERKTCTVFVSYSGLVGELYFREGHLVDARLDVKQGKRALFAMLSGRDHSLRMIDRCDVEGNIVASLTSLLMEWAVREDGQRRSQSTSPLEDE